MLHQRRFYSSVHNASSIASDWLNRTTIKSPILTKTQNLDPNQLQRLSATLSRPHLHPFLSIANSPPPPDTSLPAGYHLAYFTPSQVEDHLGKDGTDTMFNPPQPFTRRMWAGGELCWKEENLLKVGQDVVEVTKLVNAEGKVTKRGEEMIVVGVEKTFKNSNGTALVDKRNWVFRREITTPSQPIPRPLSISFPPSSPSADTRDFIQTPVSLFRFSALTFNAHKIHYSKEWCQEVEGHRDLVVHGPLNLINMLDLWRDVRGYQNVPKSIKYRATSPLYVSEPYSIVMEEENDKITEARIIDSFGNVAMTGTIEAF